MPSHDPQIEQRIRDQRIFQSELLEIGIFHARPEDADFTDSGPPGRSIFVFPQHAVEIERREGAIYVANATTVAFYGPESRYCRRAIDPRGDCSIWFALRPEVLEQVIAGPTGEPRPSFPVTHGRIPPAALLLQRRLLGELQRANRGTEPLAVEEAALDLVEQVLASATRPTVGATTDQRPGHAELALEAQRVLSCDLDRKISIDWIAAQLECSPGHLFRTFRRQTGSTLHRYRRRCRLYAATEKVVSGARILDVALDFGFSSHSHFTAAFQQEFGIRPSEARSPLQT